MLLGSCTLEMLPDAPSATCCLPAPSRLQEPALELLTPPLLRPDSLGLLCIIWTFTVTSQLNKKHLEVKIQIRNPMEDQEKNKQKSVTRPEYYSSCF